MRTRDLAVGVAALVLSFPLSAAPGEWERIGPNAGVVFSLVAAPSRPRTIYAALMHGGVFRSDDGGKTWAPANRGIGWPHASYDLQVLPQDPETVYGLSNSRMIKTTDGGRSWTKLEAMPGDGPVRAFLIHPQDPQILYAANPFLVSMRRSRDGGETWEEIPGSPQAVSALAIDPANPNVLYAGRGHGRGSGVFKSTDGGDTWKEITQGLEPGREVEKILVDPLSSQTLWLGLRTGTPGKRFWKSTDAGASWTLIEPGFGRADFSLFAAEARRGRTILYGRVNHKLHRSDDGGVSWSEIDPGPSGSFSDEAVLPLPDGELLAGTRWGVFRSRDRGASWKPSNRGLTGNAIAGLALDPRRPRIYATAEGIGLFKSEDGGRSWNTAPLAPGLGAGSLALHPQKPDTVYLGFFRHLARSDDGGKHWTVYEVPCDDPRMVVTDPALPTGLYGAADLGTCSSSCVVSKSVDDGKTWTCIFILKREHVQFLAADPVRPLTVYVQKDNDLYRSEDAGFSWHLLARNFYASGLAFDPKPSGAIYAGKRDGVVRSLDGGKSWLRSGPGLPADDPVVGIVLDPRNPAILYAATAFQGVFKSVDSGASWSPLAPAPLDVRVQSLALDPRSKALYVGTSGGGVLRWRQ